MQISNRTRAASVAAALTAGALAATATPVASAEPPADRGPQHHVVYFAMDGFDADYLDGRAELPNIEALARRGTLTTGTGVMATTTNLSWASTVSGAYPEVTMNDSYVLRPKGQVQGQTRRNAAETMGEALAEAGKTMASVQFFMLQDRGVTYGDPDALYTQPGGDCVERADDLIDILHGRPVESDGVEVTVDEVPDFMVMYCSDVDGVGHSTGAESQETIDALEHIDEQIGRVVEATKRASVYGRTTFVMSGDHGITSYQQVNGPQTEAAIDALGYETEWVNTGDAPSEGTEVALAGGGLTSVHLVGELAGDEEALARIEAALLDVEGIDAVYDKEAQAAMRMAPTFGDLVVEPSEGWAMFAENADHDRGRHGTTQELDIAFLISGSGVVPGRMPEDPRLIDIAPTINHLLGVRAPADAQGRVLTEVLTPARR